MFTIDIMVDPKCDADLHIMRTNHQTGSETTVTALYADGTLVFLSAMVLPCPRYDK